MDFVLREEEFRKQNEQLELKTRELLGKVGDVMKIQENLISERPVLRPTIEKIDANDLNLPKTVDQMGPKGMLHFYKAKIKAVQADLEKLQNDLKGKCDELKRIQKDNVTLAEEKEKWFLQTSVEKNNNAKLEKQIASCNGKLQLKNGENANLKKEVEQLKSELKIATNDLTSCESKLKRALQENEKIKAILKTVRQDEKEAKESYKHNIKDLTSTVKQIQKHKTELIHGYKKQLQLIDNLKKQKAHMESCKVLEMAEDEFLKLLEWKLD